MAKRSLDEVAFRVVPELRRAPLASPLRRAVAFALDSAIVAIPTLALTAASALLWLRLSDRPAFDALLALRDQKADAQAQRRAAADLAPLLVRIDAPGLPASVSCALAEKRLEDAGEIVSKQDLSVVLRLGQDHEAPPPGHVVLPIEAVVPGAVRGLVLFGAQAVYFTLMTTFFGFTLGKLALGIRVRRLDGHRLSLAESFERFTGYLHIPALLGWPLLDLWRDPNRQLPHDRTARTVVVRTGGRGSEPRTTAVPQPAAAAASTAGPHAASARFWHWGDVAFYFALLVFSMLTRPHTPVLWTAVAIAAVTFPLWVLARVQLGSSFSFQATARRLVATGLYSRIRHPVYLFGSLAGLASVLALQVWWILLLALLLEPITIIRAVREERVLMAAFGEEYERYRKQTWF